jgi:predicted nuclease of restriction endonuclease-like (RecB) superfamily
MGLLWELSKVSVFVFVRKYVAIAGNDWYILSTWNEWLARRYLGFVTHPAFSTIENV